MRGPVRCSGDALEVVVLRLAVHHITELCVLGKVEVHGLRVHSVSALPAAGAAGRFVIPGGGGPPRRRRSKKAAHLFVRVQSDGTGGEIRSRTDPNHHLDGRLDHRAAHGANSSPAALERLASLCDRSLRGNRTQAKAGCPYLRGNRTRRNPDGVMKFRGRPRSGCYCKLPTLSGNHFAPDLRDRRPSSPRPRSGARFCACFSLPTSATGAELSGNAECAPICCRLTPPGA